MTFTNLILDSIFTRQSIVKTQTEVEYIHYWSKTFCINVCLKKTFKTSCSRVQTECTYYFWPFHSWKKNFVIERMWLTAIFWIQTRPLLKSDPRGPQVSCFVNFCQEANWHKKGSFKTQRNLSLMWIFDEKWNKIQNPKKILHCP